MDIEWNGIEIHPEIPPPQGTKRTRTTLKLEQIVQNIYGV
jgi:hypothetical protein